MSDNVPITCVRYTDNLAPHPMKDIQHKLQAACKLSDDQRFVFLVENNCNSTPLIEKSEWYSRYLHGERNIDIKLYANVFIVCTFVKLLWRKGNDVMIEINDEHSKEMTNDHNLCQVLIKDADNKTSVLSSFKKHLYGLPKSVVLCTQEYNIANVIDQLMFFFKHL